MSTGLGLLVIHAPLSIEESGGGAIPVMDEFGTGAIEGWSLEKLTVSYSGDVILVRRSSDNMQQGIGSLANGLLDVPSLEAFCSGTDGFVATIYGQINGNNLVQATMNFQPKIVENGSVIVGSNGKPTIEFDGVDDEMIAAHDSSLNQVNGAVLAVMRPDLAGGARRYFSKGNSGNPSTGYVLRIGVDNRPRFDADATVTDTVTVFNNVLEAWVGYNNGAVTGFYRNTREVGTIPDTAWVTNTGGYRIGGVDGKFFIGGWNEHLLWENASFDSFRDALIVNRIAHYSIT